MRPVHRRRSPRGNHAKGTGDVAPARGERRSATRNEPDPGRAGGHRASLADRPGWTARRRPSPGAAAGRGPAHRRSPLRLPGDVAPLAGAALARPHPAGAGRVRHGVQAAPRPRLHRTARELRGRAGRVPERARGWRVRHRPLQDRDRTRRGGSGGLPSPPGRRPLGGLRRRGLRRELRGELSRAVRSDHPELVVRGPDPRPEGEVRRDARPYRDARRGARRGDSRRRHSARRHPPARPPRRTRSPAETARAHPGVARPSSAPPSARLASIRRAL